MNKTQGMADKVNQLELIIQELTRSEALHSGFL